MLKMSRAMNFFNQVAAATTLAAVMLALVPMQAFAQEPIPDAPVVVEPVVEPVVVPEVVEPVTPVVEQLILEGDEEEVLFEPVPMMLMRGNNPPPPEEKIDICHKSGQSGNYQLLNVDKSSVNQNGANGHGSQHSGDIIPPFGNFNGRNWTPFGQIIYNNGCVDPAPAVDINPVVITQCGPQEITISGTAHLHTADVSGSERHLFVWSDLVEKVHETLTGKNVHQNYNWSFTQMYGVGSHSIKAENKRLSPSVEVIDSALVEFTIEACPVVTEVIELCKYESAEGDANPTPIAGWLVSLTNGLDGEDEVTFSDLVTGQSGCVTQEVNLADGPFYASEEMQKGWQQDDVVVSGGELVNDGTTCKFFADLNAKNIVKPTYKCSFYNSELPGEVSACRMGDNLLLNGSFETPTVTGDWGIFNPVANWMISLSDGLELWSNGFYGGASEGEQNAELDGNAPTKITQTVTTVPGATYELRFDFSARPDADSAANNSVDAYVGNVFLMNATADGSDIAVNTWSEHAKTFVATATSTDISFEDKGTADSYGSLIDNAVLCLVAPAPQCLPELNGSWADEVTSFDQGTRKDGSPVLVARSDEADALGMADWTPGEGVDFLSLGFGGSIVLTFGPFVPDMPGNDITVFEATNGAYPAETALVEVSQDGTTWYVLGTSTNPGASSFDLAGTGLTWVKYVRLTDTSNPAAHSNDADGFDLDAVFVTKTVCEAPADPTPKTCSIVSDTTTLVDGLPSTLTWVHPNWTDELTSGEWIWDATVEATNGETATFTKTFMVDNAATGATLKVAADNRYTATLNGNPLTCDGAPADNFSAADTCAAPVVVGLNTLTFVVTNDPYATVDVQTNPSGLIFELTIDGATCSPVIPPTPTGDTYKIQGYVWHDDNQNTNWDGMEESLIEVPAESPLAGWEVRITKGTTTYATTTDADGYYYFEVPAGTWVITEVVQSGWLRTTVESHTVTVPAEMADARSAFMEWLIPTAEAAVIGLPYGDYNFGNDTETVITTTPNGGSRSSGGSSGSRPRGSVRGLSDSTPMPMVLGEQVSAIPAGAPSTGRGGAAPTNAVDSLLQLIGTSRRLQVLK